MTICSLLSIFLPQQFTSPQLANYTPLPYWSVQQALVVPACRIDVTSARNISTVIQISKLTQCPFAVKSGGHAAEAGTSSIQNGILINMAKLNMVELSGDRSTVAIGPGNTWYDVFKVLDPLGVSVVGGREAGVGVGGLTLGGGISYFSPRYGWACDNIRSYEVILADGSIVNATPQSHADLYWALRGGSGTNFGIVSRFDAVAFEQGLLWGGSRFYTPDVNASLIEAYSKFIVDAPSDDNASLYIAGGYEASLGGYVLASGPAYTKPIANASIFNTLNAIPSLGDTTGIGNMADFSVALNQTAFLRWKTVTFKNDANLFKAVWAIFVEETKTILDVPGIFPFWALQPLSLNIIEQMAKNGGNVLGLSTADGPLCMLTVAVMNMNWGWSNAADDARVIGALDRFVSRAVDLATSMNLQNRFIYMNYASLTQDVFGGYGPENEARLRKVQEKYDPNGVFKTLQPGYFKL
ncbi:FAD binding domain-containing protein [Rutstroemia sp. NJR-2017a BVV2]|nr:FAD binding domain-containing protein [Rutstroemia sp. NJR-2017a BVV2]